MRTGKNLGIVPSGKGSDGHATSEGTHQATPSASRRAEDARALAQFLATTYALYHKTLFYHWNVIGPHFVSLHKLFEKHYQELHVAGDEIAERIRALGFFTPLTLAEFAGLSMLKDDTPGEVPPTAAEMVATLTAAHETCSREARLVFARAAKADDVVTQDLMTRRMAFHDKAVWMLQSLQL